MSEMVQAGSLVRGFWERLRERQAWEAANPELARAWNEALEEDHQREMRREYEARQARVEARIPEQLRELGVPDTAIAALSAWHDTPTWTAAGKFLESDAQYLVLLGTVGTGKTVAAARVLAWALRRNLECHFVRATMLARLSGYEDRALFDRLCWAPVVVLDDLGTEHLHGFAQSLFAEWLDCRYARSEHRTVITANLTPPQFAERVGERAMDRIRHVGMVHASRDKSMRERRQ